MNLPTDVLPVPAPAPDAPFKRPTWHRIYFLLAAFDVLTVCLALFLSHQLMDIYTESVATNAEWVTRGNGYAKLGALAADVNAPGNDIFDSHDVALESRRMSQAKGEFDAQMALARRELRAQVPEPARSALGKRLDDVVAGMPLPTWRCTGPRTPVATASSWQNLWRSAAHS